MTGRDLLATPNPLAPSYSRFRVAERLLLTGHSHQAWPDRAWEGQLRAFTDAAERVDRKWERAFAQAERVRQGFRRLLVDPDGDYALAASTHELLVQLLSALPLGRRPRLVTTDQEFHSARRQLARLAEAGLEVVRVAGRPADSVGERLAAAVDDRTALVVVSTVFYTTAETAGGLAAAAVACERHGAELLLDAYHHLNVVPFSLGDGLERAFVTGGGYKYCQLGEGNCFLRLPPGTRLRPVVTGWFAEWAPPAPDGGRGAVERLDAMPEDAVSFGAGHWSFAGATYDPTSHYRAAEVFDFFAERELDPPLLREVSQAQMAILCEAFDELDLPPAVVRRDREVPLSRLAGFLALEAPAAGRLAAALRDRGVWVDSRGSVLRLGPAPYLTPEQLRAAMALLGEAARGLE
jgi:kynureninase